MNSHYRRIVQRKILAQLAIYKNMEQIIIFIECQQCTSVNNKFYLMSMPNFIISVLKFQYLLEQF